MTSGVSIAFVCASASVDRSVAQELKLLFDSDQEVRKVGANFAVNNAEVLREDYKRELKVKSLLCGMNTFSGLDFYHSAMILQHAPGLEDFLLAHDLAVLAIANGVNEAKWLSAATLDRYLSRAGELQRYGTQYIVDGDGKEVRQPTDLNVSDAIREKLDVPRLKMKDKLERYRQPRLKRLGDLVRLRDKLIRLDRLDASDKRIRELASREKAFIIREVKTTMTTNLSYTGKDAVIAAEIVSNSDLLSDQLFAHDLAIIALSHGDQDALPIAARTLDSFLMKTARPQRFATQIEFNYPHPPKVYFVDPSVPDCLRVAFGVKSLDDAKKYATGLSKLVR